jgi:hypothetical protein
MADVDTAATCLIEGLQSGDPGVVNNTEAASKAINQVNLFKQSLNKVCRHITVSDTTIKKENDVDEASLPGGGEVIPRPAVLTLTSQTDRGPKNLYSGLQRRRKDVVADTTTAVAKGSDKPPDLDPGGFPNGITVAQVLPSIVPDQATSAKQDRTFNDVFRPHRSLKALEPPRPSRNATRGSSLGWVNYEEFAGSERPTAAYKSDYRYASLPTGSWLDYNSAEALAASAPDSKRRQRDRALSFGESRADVAEEIVEHEQARTKALFQSAYSSFAPSFDNSAAVVPEKTRSQAWWNKIGQKRFQALLELQYPESALEDPASVLNTMEQAEDDFEAAVVDFEEDEINNPSEGHEEDANPREVDEVLQEISDLLQTLSSYQRIRSLSKMNSGPVMPTSAETDVYEILRSNLSILVQSLPPYAVAKLDGDQLEALNVSTIMVVETRDHVGTMELDENSLQRQRASLAATHPASGRTSVSSGAAGRPGNYTAQAANYNQKPTYSSAPRTPHGNQPRPMAAYGKTGTLQSQSHAARPAPMSAQRPGLPGQRHYPSQTHPQRPNATHFQRATSALQNGYGSSYAPSVNAQIYPQQRQGQPGYTYPSSQSPQKPGQKPQSVPKAQQQYSPHPQSRPSRASPSAAYSINHLGAISEQARTQAQAQRQSAATPQTPNVNGQYLQMARNPTPSRGTPNGRAMVGPGSGGQ